MPRARGGTRHGCTRLPRGAIGVDELAQEDAMVLLDHKKVIASLPLESDVRAALTRMIDAALAAPQTLADVIDRERLAIGLLSHADAAGLLAHLFPEGRDRHLRIIDEARLLGVDGIVKLKR
jgi:hypothetical protein